MSNDDNIQSNQRRRQGGGSSGVGLAPTSSECDDSAAAPCSGRCPSCGRTVEAGDLMLRLGDHFVHQGCHGHLRLAASATSPTGTGATSVTASKCVASDGPGEGSADRRDGPGPSAAQGCNSCYPNHMEALNRPAMVAGQCRFDVRFPGFTLDVVATTLAEAGWAAEEAVREHYPSETIEIRCSTRSGCDHPDRWVQAWTVM